METKDKQNQGSIQTICWDSIPTEFKRHDHPFGLEQHQLNGILILLAHVGLIYFLVLYLNGYLPLALPVFVLAYGVMGGLGLTIGAHRLWSHRSFKAKLPLRILLMLWQTAAWQYPIFKWARDHRVHHKYTDTNADPHNAARGFWFSHIIWLLVPKHPDHIEKLKTVDISDLAREPVLRFQSKYYWTLVMLLSIIVPSVLCKLIFPGISYWHIFLHNWARFGIILHGTALVNSVAHKWGDKPYDKYIRSTENRLVNFLSFGEGWHNYHHTFPWDYKASELGNRFNLSTVFIHFFAWIGWAYDLKTVSRKTLVDRINRTGDGSQELDRKFIGINKENNRDIGAVSSTLCWGWGDKQLSKKDMEIAEIVFPAIKQLG